MVDQEGFQRHGCMLLVRLAKTLCMWSDWFKSASLSLSLSLSLYIYIYIFFFFFGSNFCLGLKDLLDRFCERKLC